MITLRVLKKYSQKTPLNRMANPEDDGILAYLMSDSSSYATGQILLSMVALQR